MQYKLCDNSLERPPLGNCDAASHTKKLIFGLPCRAISSSRLEPSQPENILSSRWKYDRKIPDPHPKSNTSPVMSFSASLTSDGIFTACSYAFASRSAASIANISAFLSYASIGLSTCCNPDFRFVHTPACCGMKQQTRIFLAPLTYQHQFITRRVRAIFEV